MRTSNLSRTWVIGAVAATAFGAASGAALGQARTTSNMADCLTPQDSMQHQQCDMQRQPQYTTDSAVGPSGPTELRDSRPTMSLDNGGGGTQSPVVPNTTGAPATSGAPRN